MTGSAFSLTVAVPSEGFEMTGPESEIGGLHGSPHHYFCAWCKSWIFTRMEGFDGFVNVRASMLDDPSWFVPFVDFSTSKKLSWASTPSTVSYEHLPPLVEFASLIERFGPQGARPGAR